MNELKKEELLSLHKISVELSGVLEYQVLLEKVLDIFKSFGKDEKCLITLFNDDEILEIASFSGVILKESFSAANPSKLALDDIVTIEDVSSDDRVAVIGKILNAKSIIIVPLIVKEKNLGLVFLPDKKISSYDKAYLREVSNIIAQSIQNAKLYESMITDDLTKLYIQKYFVSRTETELARARRYHSNISMVMIKVDDFKEIHIEFGKRVGDYVLRMFAKLLKAHIRQVDIPARHSKEEVAVLLPETGVSGAVQVAEHLRQMTENSVFKTDNKRIPVTISIGISTWDWVCSKEDFIEQAVKALGLAKLSGKNRIERFIPE